MAEVVPVETALSAVTVKMELEIEDDKRTPHVLDMVGAICTHDQR